MGVKPVRPINPHSVEHLLMFQIYCWSLLLDIKSENFLNFSLCQKLFLHFLSFTLKKPSSERIGQAFIITYKHSFARLRGRPVHTLPNNQQQRHRVVSVFLYRDPKNHWLRATYLQQTHTFSMVFMTGKLAVFQLLIFTKATPLCTLELNIAGNNVS